LSDIFRTPLHAAAFADHVECLQLLLRHNAQVNAVDNSGKTALMMAAENGQAGAVGMYLSCGLCIYAYPKTKIMHN
jgi:ankyrin repeat protein